MADRTRVKICCVASLDEAEIATRAGADLLGLVGPMPTGPGIVEARVAHQIATAALPWAQPVLLTAFAEAPDIIEHAARVGVRAVQIVNHVPPHVLARLAETAPGLARIQVIHVEDREALTLVDNYAPHATALLLDSGRPGANELGGTGRVHDWEISAECVRRSPVPVFLAGGLTPRNVGAAITQVRPAGVDLCNGIRTNGALDPDLLAAFIEAVQEADRTMETGAAP